MKILKNFMAIVAAIAAVLCLIVLTLIFFGYRPFILKTQSMEPTYMQGSLCWVNTRVSIGNVEVGDALVYRSPANTLVLHRLVGFFTVSAGKADGAAEKSTTAFSAASSTAASVASGVVADAPALSAIMQGDANDLTQEVELSHINYVGRVAFSIPRLGTVVDKVSSHQTIWIAVGVFFILACIPWEAIKRRELDG